MKRCLTTIILALVGVLLLAACGAASTASYEAAAMEEKAEAPAREQRAAPQAEAKEAPAAEAPKAAERAPAPSRSSTNQPAVQQPRTAGATTFQDYPRATFVTTARDAVSTFSLDTDRTSFHLALNWAQIQLSEWSRIPYGPRSGSTPSTMNYAFPLREDSFRQLPATSLIIPWIVICTLRA